MKSELEINNMSKLERELYYKSLKLSLQFNINNLFDKKELGYIDLEYNSKIFKYIKTVKSIFKGFIVEFNYTPYDLMCMFEEVGGYDYMTVNIDYIKSEIDFIIHSGKKSDIKEIKHFEIYKYRKFNNN